MELARTVALEVSSFNALRLAGDRRSFLGVGQLMHDRRVTIGFRRKSVALIRCGYRSSTNSGFAQEFALSSLYGGLDTIYGKHTRNSGKR